MLCVNPKIKAMSKHFKIIKMIPPGSNFSKVNIGSYANSILATLNYATKKALTIVALY